MSNDNKFEEIEEKTQEEPILEKPKRKRAPRKKKIIEKVYNIENVEINKSNDNNDKNDNNKSKTRNYYIPLAILGCLLLGVNLMNN